MAERADRFVGRTRELGAIRSALDGPDASILRIEGMRGIGKSALVARALGSFEHTVFRVPPLPAPLQRQALARALLGDAGSGLSWDEIFAAALRRARVGEGSFVLVLDDVHRLDEARSRYMQALIGALRTARADRRALHVLLVGPLSTGTPVPEGLESERVVVGPLPLRPATQLLPGGNARDRLRAYGILGGIPRVLAAVDPEVTLETNIRKLVLDPHGPFADVPSLWLERDLQTPSRYNAILARLALGECDWGDLHQSVPDLTSSGQLAPYVKRLEELGLVAVRRSLDADPGSRSRRYALTDPLLAFWYRFVLPGAAAGEWGAHVRQRDMRGDLDEHLATVFPLLCRQHMTHDAIETLGANARESGSLWGAGYELPIAGILTSGAAFYGVCSWQSPVRGEDPLGALDAAARATRYGFGREHRLRLYFSSIEPPRWFERAAVRQDQCLLIGPGALVGGGTSR